MLFVHRRSLAGFCAAGAIVFVAGCGGGGGDGSAALSASDFRTQADAICQTSKDTIAALTQPSSSSTNAEVSAFLTAGLDATDAEIAKLRALEAPSDLSGTLGEALDLLDQRQARIRAATARVAGGEDVQTVLQDADAEIDNLNGQADAKARELGLTVCGTHEDDLGASTTPTTTTGTTATAPTTTGGATSAEVTTDLKAAQTALVGVSTSLQGASGSSLDDLKAVVPDARQALTEFDAAIAKLATDSAPNAAQEKVRSAVATAGPKVSDVLGRLLDAIENGDEAAAAALVPEVQKVFGELQTALSG
jgi:hypothetical protein